MRNRWFGRSADRTSKLPSTHSESWRHGIVQDARQFGGLGKLGTPHGNLKKLTVDDRSGMGPGDDVKKFSSLAHTDFMSHRAFQSLEWWSIRPSAISFLDEWPYFSKQDYSFLLIKRTCFKLVNRIHTVFAKLFFLYFVGPRPDVQSDSPKSRGRGAAYVVKALSRLNVKR